MPEITLYTVPNCADCAAVKVLLRRHGAAFTERNIRGDSDALAELMRRADVRIAPVTIIGEQVFYGPFDAVKGPLSAALAPLTGRR